MKKCAVINDLSGYGKCSLTASIPILSAMGVEVHPLLTAVLSNQTAYESFKSHSLTDTMKPFIEEWKKLGASFDAILTGFVADRKQLEIITSFVTDFKSENTLYIADPVMADNGMLYDGYDNEMCAKMRELCYYADLITPNTTELAILADVGDDKAFSQEWVNEYDNIVRSAYILREKGMKDIAVTGFHEGDLISNIVFQDDNIYKISSKKTGGYYSGTGDIFSSVLTGAILNGKTLYDSVKLAGDYISNTIKVTDTDCADDGIAFEKTLKELIIYEC